MLYSKGAPCALKLRIFSVKMSAEKWVVRLYRNGECILVYTSVFYYIDDVIGAMEPGGAYKEGFNQADFICVQPAGSTFVSRILQLEQAWDLSRQREGFQSSE